ncbi:hypothetical protein [Caproiciproducens galactitolivorans]|uniref:Uncharacterized protein n=1 Tax=Caproiciproducens galactitolivorans TaxID=642589 RepID=A0ABT4BVR4_9FIRM|nr:hypothetical protein [Caproiciproducens galactitolivorans]MCY1714977.1 hypothetical protein [Caproiciproducens galactitolivorans]
MGKKDTLIEFGHAFETISDLRPACGSPGCRRLWFKEKGLCVKRKAAGKPEHPETRLIKMVTPAARTQGIKKRCTWIFESIHIQRYLHNANFENTPVQNRKQEV